MDEIEEFFYFDDCSLLSEKSKNFQNELDEEVNSYDCGSVREKNAKYVELILQGMGMEKHLDKFLGSRISLETFLNLNQSDLINVGITDDEDIKIILNNLQSYSKSSKNYNIPLILDDDVIIAKNVWNQMVRLKAYAAFLILRLSKEEFIFYENDMYSSSKCLKHFTNSAISQCDIMAKSIYEKDNADNLIKKLLKFYSLELPKFLEKRMMKKQKTKNFGFYISTILSGFVCVATTAYFVKKRIK